MPDTQAPPPPRQAEYEGSSTPASPRTAARTATSVRPPRRNPEGTVNDAAQQQGEARRKFVALPHHVLDHVYELGRPHWAVLAVLAAGRDFTTDQISQAATDTADKSAIHPKSLARVLAKLVELRLIEIVNVGVGRGQTPVYRIVYEKVTTALPIKEPKRLRRRSQKVTTALLKGNNGAPAYKESDSSSDSLSDSPPKPPMGEGEGGDFAEGEDGTPLAGFDAFWNAWPACPKKIDPALCRQIWNALKLDSRADELAEHVRQSAKSGQWRKERGQYMPSPANYLRKQVYDAPPPAIDPILAVLAEQELDAQRHEQHVIELMEDLERESHANTPNATFTTVALEVLPRTAKALGSIDSQPISAFQLVHAILKSEGNHAADVEIAKTLAARTSWSSHKHASPPTLSMKAPTVVRLIGSGLIRSIDGEVASEATIDPLREYEAADIVFESKDCDLIKAFVRDALTPRESRRQSNLA